MINGPGLRSQNERGSYTRYSTLVQEYIGAYYMYTEGQQSNLQMPLMVSFVDTPQVM